MRALGVLPVPCCCGCEHRHCNPVPANCTPAGWPCTGAPCLPPLLLSAGLRPTCVQGGRGGCATAPPACSSPTSSGSCGACTARQSGRPGDPLWGGGGQPAQLARVCVEGGYGRLPGGARTLAAQRSTWHDGASKARPHPPRTHTNRLPRRCRRSDETAAFALRALRAITVVFWTCFPLTWLLIQLGLLSLQAEELLWSCADIFGKASQRSWRPPPSSSQRRRRAAQHCGVGLLWLCPPACFPLRADRVQ